MFMISTLPSATRVSCNETERRGSKGISRVYPGQSTFVSCMISSKKCPPPFRTLDETAAEWKEPAMILCQNEKVYAVVLCWVCQLTSLCNFSAGYLKMEHTY